MTVSLKQINYRGGIVKFNIPATWEEEYEEEGGGTFYEDAEDTGTLRLNIITFQKPSEIKDNQSSQVQTSSETEKDTEVMSNGNTINFSIKRTQEQDTNITLYFWNVTNVASPTQVRVACFSYTILTSQEKEEAIIKEIQVLDSEIRNVIFHPKVGE